MSFSKRFKYRNCPVGNTIQSILCLCALIMYTCSDSSIHTSKNNQNFFAYLAGEQSKIDYLKENLPLTRNFYDADGFFEKTLKSDDKVLTVEIGNMFYVNFPFWDWSFIVDRENYLQSPEILSQKLNKDGFTHILLGKINIEEFSKMSFNELEKYFEMIYDNGYFSLYRIKER